MRQHVISILILICALCSCTKHGCPICGGCDTHTYTEVVEHDICLPYRLDRGLKCITDSGDSVTITSDSLVLRCTQTMKRDMTICRDCGEVIEKDYTTEYEETPFNSVKVGKVHYYIEQIGDGATVWDFGWYVGSITFK